MTNVTSYCQSENISLLILNSGYWKDRECIIYMVVINIRNTEEAVLRPQYSPRLSYRPKGHGQHGGKVVYCGLNNASVTFLIFTTQLYKYINEFFSNSTI